jgi:hypothetical protein
MRTHLLLPLLCALPLASGCDEFGGENGRGEAVPPIAPPRLAPTELLPPRVDRIPASRVQIRDPLPIDSTQIDAHRQSDGVVDILWVIDDSGSMKNQRATLANNFDRFLQELLTLKVSFHMGVVSTNANDSGRLRGTTKIITPTTPNPRAVFATNTTFPDSRARWEQGLRMSQVAISAPNTDPGGANDGFLRPNAALAVIVVSDEDDSSFGQTAGYARALRSAKGKGNEGLVSFSVIGGTTPSGCYPPGEQIYLGGLAEAAYRYSEVASRTGGVIGSICDSSFETTLIRIAQALNTLRRVFPISLPPNPDTVTVRVNGLVIARDPINGWQLNPGTQSITFLGNYVPPPAAEVRIEYAFSRSDGGTL